MALPNVPGLLVAASLLAYGTAASAQPIDRPPESLLLADVLARVREANPALSAHRLEAAAARTRGDQVSAWRDPMVSATVNTGPGRMQRSEIMVEQAIPWPDVLRAGEDAADAAAESLERSADVALAELLLEATMVYVEAAGAELMMGQIDHFREELAGFEQAAASQYESGMGPQQAILRMQLEKNGLLRRRLELAARIESLRQVLVRLSGGEPLAGWADRPLVLPEAPGGGAPAPDSAAARRRPEWGAYEASLRRITSEQAAARKAFRPELSVHAIWMEGSIMRGGRDAFGVGIGLTVPLWRAPRHAAVEEKALDGQRVAALMEDLGNRTLADARAARIRIASLEETMDLVDGVLLPQAEATQQATAAAYTNGRADYLDLLEAERILLDLRLDRIALRVRLLTEHATLDRLVPPLGGEPSDDR
jgi:outer membrane protein TolC